MSFRSLPLVALVILGASCSSSPAPTAQNGADGGKAANGSAGMTAATWVADLTAAYCAWAIKCGRFSGESACTAYMGPQFAVVNVNTPAAAVVAVSKGTALFDPSQARSCLTALTDSDCDKYLLAGPPILVPQACAAAFSGSTAAGGACIDDVECSSGSICVDASTQTCEGTCTPVPAGGCRTNDDCPANEYCSGVSLKGSGLWGAGNCEMIVPPGAVAGDVCGWPVQCGPGLICMGPMAPLHCVDAAALTTLGPGATCGGFGSHTCGAGLACVPSDDGQTSSCMPPAKLGDPCTTLFQCGAQYELNDIVCDEARTHTCVHRTSTGPCKNVNRQGSCDPVTSYCDSSTETCRPRLPLGAACTVPSTASDPCAVGTQCAGGVCSLLLVGACTPR
jgi:hypothetical protein